MQAAMGRDDLAPRLNESLLRDRVVNGFQAQRLRILGRRGKLRDGEHAFHSPGTRIQRSGLHAQGVQGSDVLEEIPAVRMSLDAYIRPIGLDPPCSGRGDRRASPLLKFW